MDVLVPLIVFGGPGLVVGAALGLALARSGRATWVLGLAGLVLALAYTAVTAPAGASSTCEPCTELRGQSFHLFPLVMGPANGVAWFVGVWLGARVRRARDLERLARSS